VPGSPSLPVNTQALPLDPFTLVEAPRFSYTEQLLRKLRRNKLSMVSLAMLLLFLVVVLLPNQLFLSDPGKTNMSQAIHAPSLSFPFGTDRLGRDMFSRVIYATRVSLILPVTSVFFGLLIGGFLGMISGYSGGWRDTLISRVLDLIFGLPILLFAIVVVAFLGAGVINAILAMTIIFSPLFARMVRGSVLAVKNNDYIEATIALGGSHNRVLFVHILRNIFPPILVQAMMQIASAILIEASVSFLGLGTTSENPSWGRMLYDNSSILQLAPWASIFPGLAIVLVIVSFNLIADALRDAMDVALT
jgi:peptide/nickel transport system permease protein